MARYYHMSMTCFKSYHCAIVYDVFPLHHLCIHCRRDYVNNVIHVWHIWTLCERVTHIYVTIITSPSSFQIMACACLASSQHLKQWWLIINWNLLEHERNLASSFHFQTTTTILNMSAQLGPFCPSPICWAIIRKDLDQIWLDNSILQLPNHGQWSRMLS